jgi:hypothetical protein
MTPAEALEQLRELTIALISVSLSNEQNFPATYGDQNGSFEITVGNAEAMTVALRNISYQDIYRELDEARCYNFKMLDGGLILLRYRFRDREVREHSLSYLPSPTLDLFQNEPEVYLVDDIYADVVARNLVPFPIRFDFNNDAARFVEVHHPYSHLTLGQYENCRIPVSAPVTPLIFGSFILRNFYNTAFRKYSADIPARPLRCSDTITAAERGIPHIVLGA